MDNEKVYLAFGSNVGNKEENIKTALKYLDANGVKLEIMSPLYETKPLEYEEQDDFLNCVGAFQTNLSPFKLLRLIKQIEKRMGRENTVEKGPRIIDIDIIFYKRVYTYTFNLQIPHPSYKERAFVLVPLNNLIPEYVPVNEIVCIEQLLSSCVDKKSNPVKIETKIG